MLPFWRDLLAFGGSAEEGGISDPHGRLPAVWFQDSGSEEPRQRWHLDVWVPGDQVQARIDAVVAGGGRLVAEYPEHSFWVLEDARGQPLLRLHGPGALSAAGRDRRPHRETGVPDSGTGGRLG